MTRSPATAPVPRRRRLSARGGWRAPGYRAAWSDVGDYRIHWVEAGEGPRPLVLLHGLSGSSRWWQRNAGAVAGHTRVVIPDVIGFGRSRCPGPLPDVPALAEVLAQWMASLGEDGVSLVGHSMGGHLSIHLAARHPELVRRLVLVDAAGIPRPLTPRHVARFAYEMTPPRRWGDPRFLPVIVGDALAAGPFTILRALRHILRDDVRPLLSSIEAPTLIIWGENDSIVPLEHGRALRRSIPNARLLVLKGAYHNSMVDRPHDFNAALLAFLAGAEVGE
jgi:pimeloyl-ACP methyl ester carboxylesterase